MSKKFINKFCEWCDIEAPKNEKAGNLVCGLIMCWVMALLGYFAMWLVYGG